MDAAFVLLNIKENQEKDVISQLKEISHVKDIQCVKGAYDILVKVEAPTEELLNRVITWKVRKIKNIRSTYTLQIDHDSKECRDDI